jgi:hypothetical protein
MLLIQDRFSNQAGRLREEFDRLYQDPRQASSRRFAWDWWHVPGQYTLLRTPAPPFFSPAVWKKFEKELLEFGQKTLGCTAITPPWMSCYVEGCRQEVHADVPHGPFAFVFSLTPWKSRKFTGGETLLFGDEVLDWWSHFTALKGVEREHLFKTVSSDFNRLTVFDPRVPHGVSEVRGTLDPREGRLVIHGWFTDPRPHIEGSLPGARCAEAINDYLKIRLAQVLESAPSLHGTLVVRLQVDSDGGVTLVRRLVNTVVSLDRGLDAIEWTRKLIRALPADLKTLRLPKSNSGGTITLPLLFR